MIIIGQTYWTTLLDLIGQPYCTTLLDNLIGQPYWTNLLDNLIGQPYWTTNFIVATLNISSSMASLFKAVGAKKG